MSRNFFALRKNHTEMYPQEEVTVAFVSVVNGGLAFTGVGMVYHTACLAVVVKNRHLRLASASRLDKWRVLVANLICSLLCEMLLLFGLVFSLEWKACCFFGRTPAFFYVLANFASYLVLLKRLKTVQRNQNLGSREKLLTKAVGLLTMTVPLIAFGCLIVVEGRAYFTQAYCIQVLNSYISWTFTFADSGLSGGYLILFLMPLLRNVKQLKSLSAEEGRDGLSKDADMMARFARLNFLYSLTTIFSTFLHMVVTSSVATLVEGDPSIGVSHWILSEYISGPLDLCINTMVNMTLLRNIWDTRVTRKKKVAPSSAQRKPLFGSVESSKGPSRRAGEAAESSTAGTMQPSTQEDST